LTWAAFSPSSTLVDLETRGIDPLAAMSNRHFLRKATLLSRKSINGSSVFYPWRQTGPG
jgi:hypothetical protein